MPSDQSFSFFEDVYAVVRLIPRGRVTSYGAVAQYLGAKGSARLVGWAMNQANISALSSKVLPSKVLPSKGLSNGDVPAHRVVNRVGLLTGKHHFGPPNRMQQLLEAEGVTVKDDRVQDFKKLFWDPSVELI